MQAIPTLKHTKQLSSKCMTVNQFYLNFPQEDLTDSKCLLTCNSNMKLVRFPSSNPAVVNNEFG